MGHSPYDYFDLSDFEHVAIFQDVSFVWEVVEKIQPYLEAYSFGPLSANVPRGTFLENPETISIGEGTQIEPGAYIKGPCIIGKNCTIRHGAYIRGGVITGNGCVIGHDTEMKNTLLLNNAHAAHFAYLGDSILGKGVNLGAGTKCANLRLDGREIHIHIEGIRYSTKRRKLGAILGDGVQIGCNAVTNPGTLFGKNAQCYPCLNVGGYIPPRSIVKPSGQFEIHTP